MDGQTGSRRDGGAGSLTECMNAARSNAKARCRARLLPIGLVDGQIALLGVAECCNREGELEGHASHRARSQGKPCGACIAVSPIEELRMRGAMSITVEHNF